MIPHPPPLLDAVTLDDLVRAGACAAGVRRARQRLCPTATVAEVLPLLDCLQDDEKRLLSGASGRAGSGCGNGGYGDDSCGDGGYEDCNDSGYGYVCYCGGGYGYGGYGSDSGCGYGCGCGDGDSYGYGCNDGTGAGNI